MTAAPRSWFGSSAPIEWLRSHPFVADASIAVGLFVIVEVGLYSMDPMQHHTREPDVLATVLVGLSTLPIAWRRRAPRIVLLVIVLGTIPLLALNYPSSNSGLGLLVGMYTIAVHCDRRQAMWAYVWSTALILPVFIAGTVATDVDLPIIVVVANIIVFTTAFILGDAVRTRRELVAELEHRAETAERQKEEEAERAVAEERARIAREMHDVVAHGLSVMIVQAGAARRVLDDHPDQAADAMRAIETTGREAMADMRRLLGVLRDDQQQAPAMAPQPGLADVAALVEKWQQAGLEVHYEVHGTPVELSQGADVSAYRVIQEALTNVSKHAGPAHAQVSVSVDEHAVTIDVEDDGRGAAGATGAGGHGLVGMRERVGMFGGTVEAGPRPGGGFAVHAVIPTVATSRVP